MSEQGGIVPWTRMPIDEETFDRIHRFVARDGLEVQQLEVSAFTLALRFNDGSKLTIHPNGGTVPVSLTANIEYRIEPDK